MRTAALAFVSAMLMGIVPLFAQQEPDTLFEAPMGHPRFGQGAGPVVALDEAHHNFHTLGGRYRAFGNVLAADGYRMTANTAAFDAGTLAAMDVLVIANALNERNEEDWSLPCPSAFTPAEIDAVRAWVEAGGSLFLIADHMPMAGAAHDLALAFGFANLNCFALDDRHRAIERFYRGHGLEDHAITDGSLIGGRIDTVVTFTGSAFQLPPGASPIVALNDTYSLLEPATAGAITEATPFRKGGGWYQGACKPVGRGRVVFFGEAAMFSAQVVDGRRPSGFNQPEAGQNVALLRNILAWLTPAR
jgi:hypothetical protein